MERYYKVVLKKPSDLFDNSKRSSVDLSEDDTINESFDQYKSNSNKLDYFVEKIELLSEQLSTKIDKSDLENAMFSQLLTLDDSIKKLKTSYEGMGKIKNDIIREEFDEKLNNITETIDSNIELLYDKFEKSSLRMRNDSATYNNLTKIIEGKIDKLDRDDEKITLLEKISDDLNKKISNIELKNIGFNEEVEVVRDEINVKVESALDNVDDRFKKSDSKIKSIEESSNELERKISNTKVELELQIEDKVDIVTKSIEFIKEEIESIDKDSLVLNEEVEVVRDEINVKVESALDNVDIKLKDSIEESSNELERKISNTKVELELQIEDKVDNVVKVIQSVKEELESINNGSESISSLESDISLIEESIINLQRKISNTQVELKIKGDSLRKDIELISDKVNTTVEELDNKVNTTVNKVQSITGYVDDKSKSDSKEIESIREDTSNIKKKLSDTKTELELQTDAKIKNISTSVDNFVKSSIEEYASKLKGEITDVKVDVVVNEKTIKKIDSFLQENHKDLIDLKQEVFSEINNLPLDNLESNISRLEDKIDYIRETYSKINPENTVNEVIKEGLLNEPLNTDNGDPLSKDDFVTLPQLQEHYRLFINRIQQQLSTIGGGGETKLKYLDDIVGIATNPSVYDKKFLSYNHNINKFEFKDVTQEENEITEENIIYVAKDGNDSFNGILGKPKLTIKSAVDSIVSSGSTDIVIRVAPGSYIENNPIIIPDEVTIIGHSLRETTVIPQNADKDLFYVGNGNYIAEMSFRGSMPGKAIVAFDPEKPRYIVQSPYIQNCTNFIPDSIGLRIDGDAAIGPLKSMVLDSYTQYNQGGIGASITNQGYAQLVSMFTICNEKAISCESGGGCDLTNSNSSFGIKGLVADGVSGKKYAGIVTTSASPLSDKFEVDLSTSTVSISTATYIASTGEITITTDSDHGFNVGMGVTISGLVMNCGGSDTDIFPSGKNGYIFNVTEVVSNTQFKTFVGVSTLNHVYDSGGSVETSIVRPYDGQVVFFNQLYETVDNIEITDGGSGYTKAPIVTVSPPSVSWGIAAKGIANIENGSVTSIDILSNGRGYESIPTVTIAAPSSGINTATGTAILEPEYYTVKESTEISGGISTVTINENVPYAVGVGTTVNFFKQSRILATGHSFEFVGSGTEIANSIPFNGGNPPIPKNEVVNTQGGLVIHTSTNQSGNFKIGDGVTINQNTSSITGQAYEKSLLSTMTPYILSLGAL